MLHGETYGEEMNIYQNMLLVTVVSGLISGEYAFGSKEKAIDINLGDSILNLRPVKPEERVQLTPHEYVNLVCAFLEANGKDSSSIKESMTNEYNRTVVNLRNLIDTFGLKTHKNVGVPSVNIAWPELQSVVEQILCMILDKHEKPKQFGTIDLNYFIADPENFIELEKLDHESPITLNHLRLILEKLNPLLNEIKLEQKEAETNDLNEKETNNKEAKQRTSDTYGIKPELVDLLVNLCVEEQSKRDNPVTEGRGGLAAKDYVRGKGRLFNISELPDDLKVKFKDILREALKNKTGFQRIMTLFALHVLNREYSIKIIPENERSFYSPTEHSINFRFAGGARTLCHELAHAYHRILKIGLDWEYSQWQPIFSELNAPIDFIDEFFPMLKNERMSAVTNEIENYIRGKKLDKDYILALLEKIMRRGFGTLPFDNTLGTEVEAIENLKENLKIDNIIQNEELIARCFYIAAYLLPDKNMDDRDDSNGWIKEYKGDALWREMEEKLTMRGEMAYLTKEGCYLTEDRQNDLMYIVRCMEKELAHQEAFVGLVELSLDCDVGDIAANALENISKNLLIDLNEELGFHVESAKINAQAAARFEYILSKAIPDSEMKDAPSDELEKIKNLFESVDLKPDNKSRHEKPSSSTRAFKTQKTTTHKKPKYFDGTVNIDVYLSDGKYDLNRIKADLARSEVNLESINEVLWEQVVEDDRNDLFDLMYEKLLDDESLDDEFLSISKVIPIVKVFCKPTNKAKLLVRILKEKQRCGLIELLDSISKEMPIDDILDDIVTLVCDNGEIRGDLKWKLCKERLDNGKPITLKLAKAMWESVRDRDVYWEKLLSVIDLDDEELRFEIDKKNEPLLGNVKTYLKGEKFIKLLCDDSDIDSSWKGQLCDWWVEKKNPIPPELQNISQDLAQVMYKYVREVSYVTFLKKLDRTVSIEDIFALFCNDNNIGSIRKNGTCRRLLDSDINISQNLAKLMYQYIEEYKLKYLLKRISPQEPMDDFYTTLLNDDKLDKDYKKSVCNWILDRSDNISLDQAKAMCNYVSKYDWESFLDKSRVAVFGNTKGGKLSEEHKNRILFLKNTDNSLKKITLQWLDYQKSTIRFLYPQLVRFLNSD